MTNTDGVRAKIQAEAEAICADPTSPSGDVYVAQQVLADNQRERA